VNQTKQERIAAIESLLPLLHSHTTLPRTTARPGWESEPGDDDEDYEPHDPAPECNGRCSFCAYHQTRDCMLPDECWAVTYVELRHRYPQLYTLELLLFATPGRWAAAIHRVYVPLWNWEGWDKKQEWTLARMGVEWIEERMVGYIPKHVQRVKLKKRKAGDKDAQILAMLDAGATWYAIANKLDCSMSTIQAVRDGAAVRRGRVMSAQSP